ncbi:uncharacterized protein C8Q71DRAFT_797866 [Rhodofomes roseus]|uniref:rRNA-processing protein EFG1 n=1 Tax=Rhodofomes roseus TaxID=34475 RepID=A0ABQ8KA10_9APHY|nr:uncharacterized protein C8Q71DRAFT_797866 [Rhodofomes roseus]KAH9833994.1 hypothetical protein C8Q71DRAFT_797866 [Rhodofomes roseus]
MAPTRTKGAGPSTSRDGQAGSKQKGSGKHQHHRKQQGSEGELAGLPGVQKIKAALRQTRRLLAKDKLAADVRTKTERRLKALEADLAQAERTRKERALSQRYHAVKFFERRKVTRRIQQVKRQLAEDKNAEGEQLGKKERKRLEKKLEELRVDLNYIIHYPKLNKYIALFPPELRGEPQAHPDPYPHTHSRSKDSESEQNPENETDAQREEVRTWVREQMAAGEMSAEPEVELHKKDRPTTSHDRPLGAKGNARLEEEEKRKATDTKSAALEGDAFFGEDAGSEESGDGGEDEDEDDDEDMDSD